MKNKFTKGPWSIDQEHKELIVGGNQMIAVSWIKHMNLGTPTKIQTEENEANLRLIAAAPELLEALENFRKTFPVSPDGQVLLNAEFKLYDFCRAVDELIKEARGES